MNKNLLLLLFISLTFRSLFSNECEPRLTLYYDHNADRITPNHAKKLLDLIDSLPSEIDYIMEIWGYTDDTGSDQYNYFLSERRGKGVATFFKKHFAAKCEFRVSPRGEIDQVHLYTDKEGSRALNRRVEIKIFPIREGKITFKGKRGTEVDVDPDHFGTCGICDSHPRVIEILDESRASEEGVRLLSENGERLITGGMVKLEYTCRYGQDDQFYPGTVRVPIQNAEDTAGMTLWFAVSTLKGMRWEDTGIPFRTINGRYYAGEMPYLMQNGIEEVQCNIDKLLTGNCVFTLPELDRKRWAPRIFTKWNQQGYLQSCNDTNWFYRIGLRSIEILEDHGYDSYGIEYRLRKTVDFSENVPSTENRYEVFLEEYDAHLSYRDTTTIVKVPRKYANEVGVYISAIDSTILLPRYKNKRNKYECQLPLHPTQLTMRKSKQGEVKCIDLKHLRTRYNSKRRVEKSRVRRRAIRVE